jgi:death on curing protein
MMEAPVFLEVEEVLAIHQDQITRYGGSMGVRDTNLLESAVKAPASTFMGQFLNADLFEMAAAYLFYLVMNHPFIDGNKRVGTAAALTFLDVNGYDVEDDEPAFSDLVLAVTQNRAKRPIPRRSSGNVPHRARNFPTRP